MQEYESVIQHGLTTKLKRPQTAILMKQFRIAGNRPKTPLEVQQLARVDCTCCNQPVYSNSVQSLGINPPRSESSKTLYSFVGKKLSTQREQQKRLIRSGNKANQDKEQIFKQGKRLDPYEFINQKYLEIMKEQEEEDRILKQDQQQSAFVEIDLIRDQLLAANAQNTFQLTQKKEKVKSRPQSGIVKKMHLSNQLGNSFRQKKDSNTSFESPSLFITKVVDVRKMEENAYYSPRDKAIKEILNSPKAQQILKATPRTQEGFNQNVSDYFLVNQQTPQTTANTKQSVDEENNTNRRIGSFNEQQKQHQLVDIVNSSNTIQNRANSPLHLEQKPSEDKSQKVINEPTLDNPQKVFQRMPSNSLSQSSILEEQQHNLSISNIPVCIPHPSLKGTTKLKNQSYFNHQNKLNLMKKNNSATSPMKQLNMSSSRSQQMQSTTQKDTSRGNIYLTTNETLKTEEDYQTPSKSSRTHYYNDFIKSPYLTEVNNISFKITYPTY